MKKSLWLESINKRIYAKLNKDITTDVLIIGGGITGISCAYELKDYFKNITLVTMNELYSGTTGYTTAKITFQHGYIYHDLLKKSGIKKAISYYLFNKKGLDRISEIVFKENIECDYEKISSHLFSFQDEENNLRNEFKAYDQIGIKSRFTTIDKLNKLALKIDDQAQFNPLLYLEKLISLTNMKIYENTQIVKIDKNIAFTKNHQIKAKHIIVATNYPIYPNHNLFFTKLIPSASYIISGKPKDKLEYGHYINTKEPILSIRYYKDLMLLGGQSHKAKYKKDPLKQLKKLEIIGDNFFDLEIQNQWVTRDFVSIDNLPFVGRVDRNIFVATGFGKWGMTNAVASSLLIKDLILENENHFKSIFNPRRCIMNKAFLKYNLSMPKTFIKSKKTKVKISKIKKSEGKIIRFRLKLYGVYRDKNNTLHIVRAKCTHLGCGSTFNSNDCTYDCSCHGSKFNYEGKLIAGPAKKNLLKIK